MSPGQYSLLRECGSRGRGLAHLAPLQLERSRRKNDPLGRSDHDLDLIVGGGAPAGERAGDPEIGGGERIQRSEAIVRNREARRREAVDVETLHVVERGARDEIERMKSRR